MCHLLLFPVSLFPFFPFSMHHGFRNDCKGQKPFTASKREALLSMWKQNGKRSPLDPSGFHDGSSLVCCCLLLAAAGVPPAAVQTAGGTLSLLLPSCSLSHPQLEPNWLHLGSTMDVQRAPNSIWTRFPKNAPN